MSLYCLLRACLSPENRVRLAILNMMLLATQPAQGADVRAFASQAAPDITAPSASAPTKAEDNSEAHLPLEAPIDPQTYICGAGDQFQLNFWGRQNASLTFPVDPSGQAFVPKVGYVQIAGLSLKDATESLHKAVGRFTRG